MPKRLTVIPADGLIIHNNESLRFDFSAPPTLHGLHALQWHDTTGHLEFIDGQPNRELTLADYPTIVAPFAVLWQAEKDRLTAAALAAEAARLAEYNKPENARSRKTAEINNACEAALRSLTTAYPDLELLTFDKQEAEARAYQADPTAATPILSFIAAGRLVPLGELAAKVIAKADAFAVASGYFIGLRQKYEDQLDALGADATTEQIEAIAVQYSLPEGLRSRSL